MKIRHEQHAEGMPATVVMVSDEDGDHITIDTDGATTRLTLPEARCLFEMLALALAAYEERVEEPAQ